MAWVFRLADRVHPMLLPGLVLLFGALVYLPAMTATTGGFVREELAARQVVGTLLLFTVLPAYLIALIPAMRARTELFLGELAGLASERDIAAIREQMLRMSPAVWPAMAAGVAFGAYQNPTFIGRMLETGEYHVLDVGFVAGAILIWVVVAVLLAWRLPTSRALSRLGEGLEVDLYRLDRLRPLARIATGDILVAVGAMAFSPLQSLDAEFRLGNYWPTIYVGLPAAAVLFLVPLWGVHRNLRRTKQRRLEALREQMDAIDRADIVRLEPLAAHLERVRGLSSWPVDLEIVARIFAYGIIPPLAWVAAALVENFIDSL